MTIMKGRNCRQFFKRRFIRAGNSVSRKRTLSIPSDTVATENDIPSAIPYDPGIVIGSIVDAKTVEKLGLVSTNQANTGCTRFPALRRARKTVEETHQRTKHDQIGEDD